MIFCNGFKRNKKSVYSDLSCCSLSSSRLAAAAFLYLAIGQKMQSRFPMKDLGHVGLVVALDFLSLPDTLGGPQCL
jgi:hypothetical protein